MKEQFNCSFVDSDCHLQEFDSYFLSLISFFLMPCCSVRYDAGT